ncbi:hypothetical protein [Puniceibacterium sp. IMCC21224]|uniref:hypothetical protein n=1 Tax=Puniceibacterium sp. IMCC21224 TaxID=1618204 RepID=UPI00064DEC67|nr:hypothetical protein [Puniceibacterium sp. IMCC21224]KMK68632.1 hypothetical protein IMCC21224_113515 [Puniceibacterium sp. IMCC21224]
MLKFLAGGIVAALVAAWLTNPSQAVAEAGLRTELLRALDDQENNTQDPAMAAIVLGCRLGPDACYELLRAGLDIRFDDRIFYSVLSVQGFGRKARCYGAFNSFACPGGVTPE